MSQVASEASPQARALIADYRPGFALPAAFYTSDAVYQTDLDAVFYRHWMYAGHAGEVAEPGDYFLLEVGAESVIIARGRDGEIRAFANVCRHRGSRICTETAGRVAAFVCPYHAWTYNLDGGLRTPRNMPAGFDASRYALKPIRCAVFHGMIFINLDAGAPDLNAELEAMDASYAVYDLANARVAAKQTWRVAANWKLAVENFMECYHCAPAHAEYARCHALTSPADNAKRRPAMLRQAAKLGYRTATVGGEGFPVKGATPYYYARNALYESFVTGSKDGRPLAPLLGDIVDYGGGVADTQIGPASFGLLYADHAVVYRFTPCGAQCTDMEIVWLVRADATAGRDYDIDRLTWLWRITSDADKKIIENNAKGVNSKFYTPGPLSEMEEFTTAFIEWYLTEIG